MRVDTPSTTLKAENKSILEIYGTRNSINEMGIIMQEGHPHRQKERLSQVLLKPQPLSFEQL